MAETVTRAEFERWVEPQLTTLARYAGRLVAPARRDDVVQRALVRAYQRQSSYDASRDTPVAWLLGFVPAEARSHHARRLAPDVVELVDATGAALQTRDVDLERAVEGLRGRERRAVDLHHFVGLEVAEVAEVVHSTAERVEATLREASERLRDLLGDPDPMDVRLEAAARRWQDEQPPPPEVPVGRLGESLGRTPPDRRLVVAAAVVVLLVGAVVARAVHGHGADAAAARPQVDPPVPLHLDQTGPAQTPVVRKVVPFRDLDARHPRLGHDQGGVRVTPFDGVSANGHIEGSVHPGDTLVFDAVLESPGLVSLQPCPDYTIAFGTLTTTRQLNCAQVPYFASLVRSDGQVSSFRPVLPAGNKVTFRMHVKVPDQLGRQKVLWTLEGPRSTPGFFGLVEVTPR